MYTYSAGSPGTFIGFGTKMTMTAEQVAQQRAWAALPQYEKDLINAPQHIAFGKKSLIELEGRLKQAIAEGHEQNIKAMTEAIANMRDNWIPMWEKKLAEAKAEKARALAARTDITTTHPQTPLEKSLDPRRPLPAWVWPAALAASAFFLWRLKATA